MASSVWCQQRDRSRKWLGEAKTIQNLANLLALFQQCGDDKIQIDPVALGHVHSLIESSILNIWETLDNFIYIVEARQVLADDLNEGL